MTSTMMTMTTVAPRSSSNNSNRSSDDNNNNNNNNNTTVEEALTHAVSLVQAYAERNPHDQDPHNPWNNPNHMLQDLDQARDEIVAAWSRRKEQPLAPPPPQQQQQQNNNINDNDATENDNNNNDNMAPAVREDFRALYMDMIADAFADVLEEMQQQQQHRGNTDNMEGNHPTGGLDVDILVDCLQSGMDLLSAEERGLLGMGMEEDDDADDDDADEDDDMDDEQNDNADQNMDDDDDDDDDDDSVSNEDTNDAADASAEMQNLAVACK